VIRRSIVPGIGPVQLEALTARRIQDFLDGLVAEGTGYTEARHALTIVRQMLRYAELGDLIRSNPALACEAPLKMQSKPRALTDLELEAVREAARNWQFGGSSAGAQRSEYLADALDTMLGLGVRIGEALALRWCDVDIEGGLVHVRGTLVEVRAHKTEAGEHVPGQFFRQDWRKSGMQSNELVVEAPPFVLEVLGRRMVHSPLLNPVDAVFVTRKGTFVRPGNIRSHFRNAKAAAGLNVELDWAVPHKLRATALTAVSNAAGIQEAARLGGHSSHQITQRYYIDPGPVKPVRHADVLEGLAPIGRP
jgi:integrase